MSADHPLVIAAREAETQVADRLHAELATAVLGVESELAVTVSRVQFLDHQRQRAAERVDRLAGLRASYANALSETSSRAKQLERAEQGLSEARSTRASARNVQPDQPGGRPRYGHPSDQPESVDDRAVRAVGRTVDRHGRGLADRAGGGSSRKTVGAAAFGGRDQRGLRAHRRGNTRCKFPPGPRATLGA